MRPNEKLRATIKGYEDAIEILQIQNDQQINAITLRKALRQIANNNYTTNVAEAPRHRAHSIV